jgi:hypothetical protein
MAGKVSFHLPACGYVRERKQADQLLESTASTSWSEQENPRHKELLISIAT